ncbi:Smt1p Ecym_5187 [Eremothecium cymbalariae DBVPG|uniref:Uncharacterized protein n=1 Tax=Eremothecium cymbalariae (strain CBS 270.75 / DBVPG 7215 / KCTC 17166 / NRRL Y-17582) TaxID=931890 RepID=I6ND17_ERECY|nr:hypothetical protein Ecym_5187 [Eremothecium cymbalariae DBVPG\
MKRYFSILRVVAANVKKGKTPELDIKSTLKYLSQNRSALSLFNSRNQQHEERIVELLNDGLPDVSKQERNIMTHYEVLMYRLRDMVEHNMHLKPLKDRILECGHDSGALYRLIWEQALYHEDGLKPQDFYRIVMRPGFSTAHVKELMSTTNELPKYPLDFSVILCNKSKRHEYYAEWRDKWIENYEKLAVISQRLVWRVALSVGGIDEVKKCLDLLVGQDKITQTVMLHQVLYLKAHLLPPTLLDVPLTRNQLLFCTCVKMLSKWSDNYAQARKLNAKLVRSSLKNRLSEDVPQSGNETIGNYSTTNPNIPIFQYQLMQCMGDLLTTIVNDPKATISLQKEADSLLKQLHEEQKLIQSEMLLQFL